MRIVALDPGGTTGICFMMSKGSIGVRGSLYGEHHKDLYDTLSNLNPDIIIYEEFDHREKAALLVSVEYIGVAKLWAQINQKAIEGQRPTDVKLQWPNEKLKVLGLRGSTVHEDDATRHMLWYVTNTLKDNTFVKKYAQAQGRFEDESNQ